MPPDGGRCGEALTSWVDAVVVARRPLAETDDATTVPSSVYRDAPGVQPTVRLELLDREGRRITPVDVAYDGGPPNNFTSENAVMSPDGRFIAFTSTASNLVPGDIDQPDTLSRDVCVRDAATGSTWRVSAGAGDRLNRSASSPQISADGRYVAFSTERSGSCLGCVDQFTGYLWDRDADALTPLGTDREPMALSREGSTILLREGGSVVVLDRVTGVRTTIGSSGSRSGVEAAYGTAVSADGSVVVFVDPQHAVRVWRRTEGASCGVVVRVMREFRLIDPSGNNLRFGTSIQQG